MNEPRQNRRNYYRILHVQPDAPAETIAASYRTLMRRLGMHPDLGGDHWNASVINEAYATLRDPARRAAYDQTLATTPSAGRSDSGDVSSSATSDDAPAGDGHVDVDVETGAPQPDAGPDAGTEVGPVEGRLTVTAAPPPPIGCAFCRTIHSDRATRHHDAQCSSCHSPLFAVTRDPRSADEMAVRALQRIDRRCPVELYVTWPQPYPIPATSLDVSVHGMGLLVGIELWRGQRIKIACDFCDAVGEVTRATPSTSWLVTEWHVGVRFLTLRVRRSRGGIVSTRA